MESLLAKIKVCRDPSRSRDTRNMQVDIEVVMEDGTIHRGTCSAPPGSWGQPVDPVQHREKVRDCLSVRLDKAGQERVLESLARLEDLSPGDLARTIALLA
jgi:hypothetical protein